MLVDIMFPCVYAQCVCFSPHVFAFETRFYNVALSGLELYIDQEAFQFKGKPAPASQVLGIKI